MGNSLDPSLPNQWAATMQYNQNQIVQAFPAWSSGTTYTVGQTINYTVDGNTYSSLTNSNTNHIPSATIGTSWALMPVLALTWPTTPTTTSTLMTFPASQSSPVIEWLPATVYGIGSFVMFDGTEYVSLIAVNTGKMPNAVGSTSWAAVSNGTLYMSLINLNMNNNPASTPANWSALTTYAIGNVVAGSDGFNYTSRVNSNLNNNPANNANPTDWTQGAFTAWTTSFIQGGGNQQWLQVGGSSFPVGVGLTPTDITYPLNAGPSSQSQTRKRISLAIVFWLFSRKR